MSFAADLKATRERLGLTQAKAAALLEISKSSLEKWENGTKEPKRLMQEGAFARLAHYQKPSKS